MAQVTITINSREYGIACGDGQESHIIKLSRLLDEKAKLLTSGNGQINENMLLAMVGLLLADELEDAKKGVVPTVVAQPQVIEKVVEVEKVVEKIVEVEKPVEKIIEVEKPVDNSVLDEGLAKAICDIANQIKNITQEVQNF